MRNTRRAENGRRKVFEDPGVEPVFREKAIGVLQSFTASQLLP
jgi:hypothetical protein